MAEEVLRRPLVEGLLSAEAVAHAVSLMRRMAQQERTQAVVGPTPEIVDIEARIARLQAQVDAGVLETADVAPSIEALEIRRDAVLKAAWRRAVGKVAGAEVPGERLYRDAAEGYLSRLNGDGLMAAREALRDLMEPVTVRPHESGEYLVAQVGINATPLLRAAGIASNGSGGVLWPQARLVLELRRAA